MQKLFRQLCSVMLPMLMSVPFVFSANEKDLKSVQQQISNVQKKISSTQNEQTHLSDLLAQKQAQLKAAEKQLTILKRKQQKKQSELETLQSNLTSLQTEITGIQAQIARLLRAQYQNQQLNAIMLFLENTSQSDKSRYLQYIRYLNQANQIVITKLKEQQQTVLEQQQELTHYLQELATLQKQQQKLIRQLQLESKQYNQKNQQLSQQLYTQNQTLSKLQNDEKQLTALIQKLAREAAEKKKAAAQARQQALAATRANSSQNTSFSSLTVEDLSLRASEENQTDNDISSHFSQQQGQMKLPITGKITGKFGQKRHDGGIWRGIFIESSPTNVRSIAGGKVGYADTFRGYGKMILIDHGDGYLSVYSGLSKINVSIGSHIKSGQIIGTSGSLPSGETGLYLEIRYYNQPTDPLSWLIKK